MQTSRRGVWTATGVVLLLGLLVVIWAVSPNERQRRSVMERLEPGDSVSRVLELLGQPAARCQGGQVRHLDRSFPPGWPASSVQTALRELEKKTRERWVYPVGRRGRAACTVRDGQSELGVTADGRIVWLVDVVGKTPLRLSEEFTPGAPNGRDGS